MKIKSMKGSIISQNWGYVNPALSKIVADFLAEKTGSTAVFPDGLSEYFFRKEFCLFNKK